MSEAQGDSAPTSYERIGGEPALRRIMDEFVDRIFDDIMIGFLFVAASRERIKEMEYQHAAEFLGAPVRYEGRPLRQAHAKHPIMGGHFGRRLQILKQVLARHGVPEDIRDAWLAHNLALLDQVTQQDLGECRD
jgi:hemoglobin